MPEARKRGIGVIAMKVLGGPMPGGARITSPQEYAMTLRYVWSIPGLSVAIIGIRNVEELRKALAAPRAYQAFTPEENSAVEQRGRALAAQWGPLRGPVA